jgi:Transposase DDE domain
MLADTSPQARAGQGYDRGSFRIDWGPKQPVLHRYRDGSYRSLFGGVAVRVIQAEITIATTAGRVTGVYRLITTLLHPDSYPAIALMRLYHERWEIETAYLELKSSLLGGRVLHARTPAGVEQEVYALLVTYQILHTAMADATNSSPDVDPDRASFTVALYAVRDQVIQAAGVVAGTVIDLVGRIGRVVLDNLMPDRRLRINARTVKHAISKYNARGPNIDRRTYEATLHIDILAWTASPEPYLSVRQMCDGQPAAYRTSGLPNKAFTASGWFWRRRRCEAGRACMVHGLLS